MSQLRVAEFDLYQEIEEEGLREVLRQMAENIRNLQAQLDELEERVQTLEFDQLTDENNAGASDSIIYAIALG
ncbi:MAG: hypothetical protein VW879_11115 [Opitutae bacterium]